MYYEDKLNSLKDIFGTDNISLNQDSIIVNGQEFPIINDVIILLEPQYYPSSLLGQKTLVLSNSTDFAPDIQNTFGAEWQEFSTILPEHRYEFDQYFDLVDFDGINEFRVCDLGCGIGRWSYFLTTKCRELVLVDFSEAIFVARENLRDFENTLFFMADIKKLPFRNDFCDFMFCLGVLHHLPSDVMEEVRALKKYSHQLLIYLYYALDNRPFYFKFFLAGISFMRKGLSRIKNSFLRFTITWAGTVLIYIPLVLIGTSLSPFGLGKYIPLYEGYKNKGLKRIRQDVYDRFFTRIEQRVSKKQIIELQDSFSEVVISEGLPYWHFLCIR